MSEIHPVRETIVHCKLGGRNAKAIRALVDSGFTVKLINVNGGIIAWANEAAASVAKYSRTMRKRTGTIHCFVCVVFCCFCFAAPTSRAHASACTDHF
jgi:hypothetical protein